MKQRIMVGVQWGAIASLIYLLITGIGILGTGFQSAAGDQARSLFGLATNPILGLIVGTAATALIQSSSTVTAIIVGLVAGGLPVAIAIPMVMGANIGTTITNTLVSLGHIRNREEFERAFAAATIHDLFNLLCVLILLPLEIAFGVLETIGKWVAQPLVRYEAIALWKFDFLKTATAPGINLIQQITRPMPSPLDGIILILVGMVLILMAILGINRLLQVLVLDQAKEILQAAMGRSPLISIGAGALITALVQSSSTTTSLVVPLAATEILSLNEIYPFVLGANIGTCVTALLAATAVTSPYPLPALQIAIVHLMFNTLGVVIIYGIPGLRQIPPNGAIALARLARRHRYLSLLYLAGIFFVIPGICLGASLVVR
jgi:sodium-dependent phosphate cotransporter